MNLKCAIVDDEPLALGLLESYVNKTPFLELVGKYSSAVRAAITVNTSYFRRWSSCNPISLHHSLHWI